MQPARRGWAPPTAGCSASYVSGADPNRSDGNSRRVKSLQNTTGHVGQRSVDGEVHLVRHVSAQRRLSFVARPGGGGRGGIHMKQTHGWVVARAFGSRGNAGFGGQRGVMRPNEALLLAAHMHKTILYILRGPRMEVLRLERGECRR